MSDRDFSEQRNFIDIQQIADEIRRRVEQRVPPGRNFVDGPAGDCQPSIQSRSPVGLRPAPPIPMAGTEDIVDQISTGALLVGSAPPTPPTARGKIGRPLVSAIRRALFWYTPQIQRFQRAVGIALREQMAASHELNARIAQIHAAVQRLSAPDPNIARIPVLERRVAELHRAAQQSVARVDELQPQLDSLQQRGELPRDVDTLIQAQTRVDAALVSASAGLRAEISAREQLQLRLDALQQDVSAALNAASQAQNRTEGDFASASAALRAEIGGAREQLQLRMDALQQDVSTGLHTLHALQEQLRSRTDGLIDATNRISTEAREALLLKSEFLAQRYRIDLLFKQLRDGSQRTPSETAAVPAVSGGMADPLYVEFERIFRGGRSDIKNRVTTTYIGRLQPLGIGGVAMPVVDIGCGRGEWLEALIENGMSCAGVDINSAMVDECRQRNLPAHMGDGIEFLRRLPAESQGAVTAFHIVEHMPVEKIIDLLDEAVRVLKPGGILIVETPNPENLLVSSLTFHLDPTHRAPLPPALMKFLAESRGLASPEMLYLHRYPESYRIMSRTEPDIAAFLNERFYGPQDYALIATRL